MSPLIKSLFFAVVLICAAIQLPAQDGDYLKHRKAFDLCSFHRQCTGCNSCNEQRLEVKIKNNSEKKAVAVFYKFYSPVFNQIIEKEAKIQGNKIDGRQTGKFYICVLDSRHWIISKIVYADESSVSFSLHDHLDEFLQEPDECDCND